MSSSFESDGTNSKQNLCFSWVLWTEYLNPPQIHITDTLTPKVMILEGGAFGGQLSHGSRSLMNGISVLIKETP